MMLRRPCCAASRVRATGASAKSMPTAARRAAILRVSATGDVPQSTTSRIRPRIAAIPPAPRHSASTSRPLGRERKTRSVRLASSASEAQGATPSAATRRNGSGRRSTAYTGSLHFLAKLTQIGSPMVPTPITPRLSIAPISALSQLRRTLPRVNDCSPCWPRKAWAQSDSGMGILGRLFLLVAIALVPVTAIQIYDEMDRHHSREAELNAEALRLATLVDMEQNRVLEGARQLLIAVAQLRSLREHDRTRCKDLFGRFATRFPYYVYIAALDLKGNAFCATRTDLDRGALTPERPFFAGALTSHDFAVGGFSRTKDGKGVLQLGFPIINERDGRVTGVLVAALNLEWLSANLGMNILPPHAVLNVADRYGTIIAHLPQSSALNVIGEPLP